jgi:hypothetical protein
VRDDEHDARGAADLPGGLRAAGWLSCIFGLWGLIEETARGIQGEAFGPLQFGVDLVAMVGGVALLRRLRWGYIVTFLGFVSSLAWGIWFFATALDVPISTRLAAGIPVILLVAILPLLMLLPSSRRWFTAARSRRERRSPPDRGSA